MDSNTQSPPNSASTTGTKRSKFFLPLSGHGMPKTPAPTSPGGSVKSWNRFHKDNDQRSIPASPGSPPMSACTFNTIIDSEPPCSPRSMWGMTHLASDGSTLVDRSPGTSPSIPPIPKFDNIELVHSHRRAEKTDRAPTQPQYQPQTSLKPSPKTSLKPSPKTSPRTSPNFAPSPNAAIYEQFPTPIPVAEKTQEGNVRKEEKDIEEKENLQPEIQSPRFTGVNRLTSRMRSMFGTKKSKEEKRALKEKKAWDELDRLEDVHWTEM